MFAILSCLRVPIKCIIKEIIVIYNFSPPPLKNGFFGDIEIHQIILKYLQIKYSRYFLHILYILKNYYYYTIRIFKYLEYKFTSNTFSEFLNSSPLSSTLIKTNRVTRIRPRGKPPPIIKRLTLL